MFLSTRSPFMKENNITGNTFADPKHLGRLLVWKTPSIRSTSMGGSTCMVPVCERICRYDSWFYSLADDLFDKYSVQVAIVSPRSVLRLQLEQSPKWQMIYGDEMAVVLEVKQ